MRPLILLILFILFSFNVFAQEMRLEITEIVPTLNSNQKVENNNSREVLLNKGLGLNELNSNNNRSANSYIIMPEGVREYLACALRIYSDGFIEKVPNINVILKVDFITNSFHFHSGVLPDLGVYPKSSKTGLDGCFTFKVVAPFFSSSFILSAIPQDPTVLTATLKIDVAELDLVSLANSDPSLVSFSKDSFHLSSSVGTVFNFFSIFSLAKMNKQFGGEGLTVSLVRLYGGGYACGTPLYQYSVPSFSEAHKRDSNVFDVSDAFNLTALSRASRTVGCTIPISVKLNDYRRVWHFKCISFNKGQTPEPVIQNNKGNKENVSNKFSYEMSNKVYGNVIPEVLENGNEYIYNYNVKVTGGSQSLDTFQVGKYISLDWIYKYANEQDIKNFISPLTSLHSIYGVPIKSENSPENWTYGLDNWNHIGGGINISDEPVKFALKSKRLPVLTPVYLWGKIEKGAYSDGGEPDDKSVEGLEDPDKTAFVVWTIGPSMYEKITVDIFRKNILENITKVSGLENLKYVFEQNDLGTALEIAKQMAIPSNAVYILDQLQKTYNKIVNQ